MYIKLLKFIGEKNKKNDVSSHAIKHYLVELGVSVLFMMVAFLFGEKIDVLLLVYVFFFYFIVLPIITYTVTKIINSISRYFRNK